MIFQKANALITKIESRNIVKVMLSNHIQQRVINKAITKYFLKREIMWLKLDERLKALR